jgi:hypothetical protein
MAFASQLGTFCKQTLDLVESLRKQLGMPAIKAGQRAVMEEQNAYNEKICQYSGDKFRELLSRVHAQINVVCGTCFFKMK